MNRFSAFVEAKHDRAPDSGETMHARENASFVLSFLFSVSVMAPPTTSSKTLYYSWCCCSSCCGAISPPAGGGGEEGAEAGAVVLRGGSELSARGSLSTECRDWGGTRPKAGAHPPGRGRGCRRAHADDAAVDPAVVPVVPGDAVVGRRVPSVLRRGRGWGGQPAQEKSAAIGKRRRSTLKTKTKISKNPITIASQ